jgi:predicted phage tail protein
MIDDLKNQLQDKIERQKEMQKPKNVNSADVKDHHRKIGMFIFVLGLIAVLLNIAFYYYANRIQFIMLGAMIVLLGLGLKMMITGVPPKTR